MENREDILDALIDYGKNPNQQEVPLVLEHYLNTVAKNGETIFPWVQLKPLIFGKMEKVIQELKQGLDAENVPSRPNVENVRFDVMHARIIDALHRFNGAPFTIQRLCELLTDPKRHYKRSDKFMRGLEKNVLVVSTVDPFGRKVVCDSSNKHMVNGMDLNGSFPPRDTALTVPLPPVPGWVTTSSAATSSQTQTSSSESSADQRLSSQTTTQAPGVVSNGIMSGGLTSSVYSDQGEQLAVQSEEVIEETVVTMETNDVGSVASDAGEALAEGDEDEDMTDDRTSSSSSSSSSSEELSTSSDSITFDSNIQASTSVSATSSSVESDLNEHHAWVGAQDEEEKSQSEVTESLPSCQKDNEDHPENSAKDNPCSPPTSTSTSLHSHEDVGPALINPESSPSAVSKQAEVDSDVQPLPESSVADSSQSVQISKVTDIVLSENASVKTVSANTSLPNDSISTTSVVPDSVENIDDSCTSDTQPPASLPTCHSPSLATSLNPDSQVPSSSEADMESDPVGASCDRLTEPPSEPIVSSSSSSTSTSSPTVPPPSTTESVVAVSKEVVQDSAHSSMTASESDDDSEPPRKCLKLSESEDTVEKKSSWERTDLQETAVQAHSPDVVDSVDSSVDDSESHSETEVSEDDTKHKMELEGPSEVQASEISDDNVEAPSKSSTTPPSEESTKEAEVTDETSTTRVEPDSYSDK